MRTDSKSHGYTPLVMQLDEVTCTGCDNRLYACNDIRRRPLQTLNGKWLLEFKDKVCRMPRCPRHNVRMRPAGEAEMPMLPRISFGFDVFAFTGETRTKGRLSLPEIHRVLQDEYGLDISPRHVSNLFRIFLAMVHCVNGDSKLVRDKLRKQGRVMLCVDAVQFDLTSPALYVVRDTISKTILYSERVGTRSAERLVPLLEKVKSLDVPIEGVVSDKEYSLVVAVQKALPDVPHQYCQTHFLKNVVEHMDPDLTALGNTVKDVVFSVRKIERKLGERAQQLGCSEKELSLARSLCKAATSGGKTTGDSITDPSPLKRFERLTAVIKAGEQATGINAKTLAPGAKADLRKTRAPQLTSPLVHSVLGALVPLLPHRETAQRLREQVTVVRQVAHILGLRTSATQVKRMLSTYLNRQLKRSAVKDQYNPLGRFILHLDTIADRYWPGLFYTYDNADIPRTNNDLERVFGSFKRAQRKATGRKCTSGGPLETCAEFLIEAWDMVVSLPDVRPLLRQITPEQLERARDEMAELSEGARVKRQIQRDPDRFLSDAVSSYLKR